MRGAHTHRAAHAAPRRLRRGRFLGPHERARQNYTIAIAHSTCTCIHTLALGTWHTLCCLVVSPTPSERERWGKRTNEVRHTSTRQSTQESYKRDDDQAALSLSLLRVERALTQAGGRLRHIECTLAAHHYPFYSHTLVTHPGEGGQHEGMQRIGLWGLAGHLTPHSTFPLPLVHNASTESPKPSTILGSSAAAEPPDDRCYRDILPVTGSLRVQVRRTHRQVPSPARPTSTSACSWRKTRQRR
jgi:hypothetical protein